MMLAAERRDLLLRRLEADGKLVAKDVAAELGISEDSVRRDLRELAAAGLCQRVYGGALPVSPALADYAARSAVSPESKERVARRAAALIRPGDRGILDGGTTTLAGGGAPPPAPPGPPVTPSPPNAAPDAAGHRDHAQPDDRRRAGRAPGDRGLRARRPAVQALGGDVRRRRRRRRPRDLGRPLPARRHGRAPRRGSDDGRRRGGGDE